MDNDRTLFVANLGPEVTEALLRELFLQAGPIEKVRLVVINGTPKPFAHIVFFHESSVHYATEIFKGTKLHRRELILQPNNAGREGPSHYAPPRVNNAREERNDFPPRGNYHREERTERGNHYRNETPPHRDSYYGREERNDYSPRSYPYHRNERDGRSRGHYREDRNERPHGRHHHHHHRDSRNDERSSHGYHHQTKYTYG